MRVRGHAVWPGSALQFSVWDIVLPGKVTGMSHALIVYLALADTRTASIWSQLVHNSAPACRLNQACHCTLLL